MYCKLHNTMSGRQMSAGGSRESSPNKTWGYCGKSALAMIMMIVLEVYYDNIDK